MNSKIRYIPLVIIGAIILSLLAVMPAFGAGEVSFILPGDINERNDGSLSDSTPDEQEWGRQGGEIGLMLEDDSLDVPVRRVLIPDADATSVGTSDIKAHSAELTLTQKVEKNDYVMVGDHNVRKVEEVEAVVGDPYTSTADILVSQGDTSVTAHTFKIVLTGADATYKLGVKDPTDLPPYLEASYTPPNSEVLPSNGEVTVTIGLAAAATKVPEGSDELITATINLEATKTGATKIVKTGTVTIEVKADLGAPTTYTVTLDTPFAESGDDLAVHRINDAITDLAGVDWADNYALYAMAIELTGGPDGNTDRRQPYTRHDTKYLIVDSDIASTSDASKGTVLHRLTGGGSGRVNKSDALVVNVEQATPSDDPKFTVYTFDNLDDDQVVFDVNDDDTKNNGNDPIIPIGDDKVYLAAWFEEPNDTGSMVSVRSQAYTDSTTIVLRETGPGSGNFALRIEAVKFGETDDDGVKVPNTDETIPTLPVNPRDVVTLSSPDSTETVTIETTKPVFSGLTPAHNTSGRASRPEVSAQVTDGDSGLTDSNIKVLFLVEEDGKSDKTLGKTPESTGDVDEISGGFEVTEQLSGSAETPDGDAKISWWVMATDDAGNVGFSDLEPSKDGVLDTCEATDATVMIDDDGIATGLNLLVDLGCDPYVILVDDTDPELLRAETGRNWNSGLITGDSKDKTEYRVSKASRDSILVVFDSHLDATTVSASDFEVNDSRPQDADVQNVTVRDDTFTMKEDPKDSTKMIVDDESGTGNSAIAGDNVQDVDAERGYVFLTLSSDLTPNARPKVEVVGEIADLAGNNQNTGKDDDAEDRIGPTLTVTIDEGDRPVTKDKINLTITSDENVGTPIVTFYEITSSDEEDMQTVGGSNPGTVRFVSATEYKAEIDAGNDEDGLYTVYVTAVDASGGNEGTAGDKSAPVDVVGETTAILFEHDESIGNPDVNPDMDGVQDEFTIDDPNAFIRIDFSAEANEYDDGMYDRNDPATPDTAGDDTRGDDFDTHASVTIDSATLGGVDITGVDETGSDLLKSNDDGNVFLYKASGLSIGEHKLEIVAKDEAGNIHPAAVEATITITERKPYSLKLNPGWNLVSIPGNPAVTDINTVIPADHPIERVITLDPFQVGKWLTAERDPDSGMFVGTLEHITSARAYWLLTKSFMPLNVNIPKQAAGRTQVPPIIPIAKGWNLVPILDVDGDFELEFNTDSGEADDKVNYFSGLTAGDEARGIYGYNTITRGWMSVQPQDVEIGKGYWIYADKAGVIIP